VPKCPLSISIILKPNGITILPEGGILIVFRSSYLCLFPIKARRHNHRAQRSPIDVHFIKPNGRTIVPTGITLVPKANY
jgi:hypothetical protein